VHHAGKGREEPVQCDQGQLCKQIPESLGLRPGAAWLGAASVRGAR
jgi:hypothetical protein